MTTSTIATCDHGIVTRTKRVILDRDIYEKKWKLGPFSKKKADLKEQGKLDKYGRMTDSTPEAWKLLFGDDTKATTVKEVADKVGVKVRDSDLELFDVVFDGGFKNSGVTNDCLVLNWRWSEF